MVRMPLQSCAHRKPNPRPKAVVRLSASSFFSTLPKAAVVLGPIQLSTFSGVQSSWLRGPRVLRVS